MTDALFLPGLVPAPFARVRAYLETSPDARRRVAQAGDVIERDLLAWYADDDTDTRAQELVFVAVCAALVDWARRERALAPDLVLGQSFGGFIAAWYAGSVSFDDLVALLWDSHGVELDYFRSLSVPVECTFLFRVPSDDVRAVLPSLVGADGWAELCVDEDYGVSAVSGTAPALARLREWVDAGPGRVLHTIERAEHCPQVRPFADRLRAEVYSRYTFRPPKRRMIGDTDGSLLVSGEDVARELVEGWLTPLSASTGLAALAAHGATRLVVPGPPHSFGRVENAPLPVVQVTLNRVTGEGVVRNAERARL